MDTGIIGIIISGFVGSITVLNFIHMITDRKESKQDKLAKASDVNEELLNIRKNIESVNDKIENQGITINILQTKAAVFDTQRDYIVRELDKLGEKIDQWRNDE